MRAGIWKGEIQNTVISETVGAQSYKGFRKKFIVAGTECEGKKESQE